MSEHCDDDGKGGCKKHPPTMCLVVTDAGLASVSHWLLDEECPGLRCYWPARVQDGMPFSLVPSQAQSMAMAYNEMLRSDLNLTRGLRRVRAAEKLRAKGKVTPGVVFEG